MKNEWWTKNKATELQELANTQEMRGFFSSVKTVYGPATKGSVPLQSKDGNTLIKEQEVINARRKDHFEDLINGDCVVDQSFLSSIPQRPVKDDLGATPELFEVEKAIKQLRNNKASGGDEIPADILKLGGNEHVRQFHLLIFLIWNKEQIPEDLRDAIIVALFEKDDRSECGNYRGVSLLAAAGKVLARTLLNRLLPHAEEELPESQCGFRSDRGTIDMVFSVRQLQENCREQHQPLYMVFFDLTKAFDSVNRAALWNILLKLGCPQKFVNNLSPAATRWHEGSCPQQWVNDRTLSCHHWSEARLRHCPDTLFHLSRCRPPFSS